jgi:hypothetical protein
MPGEGIIRHHGSLKRGIENPKNTKGGIEKNPAYQTA